MITIERRLKPNASKFILHCLEVERKELYRLSFITDEQWLAEQPIWRRDNVLSSRIKDINFQWELIHMYERIVYEPGGKIVY